MNDTSSQITYSQLLERHERIRIPMIQRDYAQGRPTEEEIREEFLAALEGALKCSPDDHSLPLNLDFIYGSVEQEKEASVFSPLDGQQRLTTLFLLHWYLAWNDEAWTSFQDTFRLDGRSRFSYNVRPSSNEFFNGLVAFLPGRTPTEVTQLSDLIIDQPWYFRNWRLDPTIQSTLCMLDAIHSRFAGSEGLYSRLASATSSGPAATHPGNSRKPSMTPGSPFRPPTYGARTSPSPNGKLSNRRSRNWRPHETGQADELRRTTGPTDQAGTGNPRALPLVPESPSDPSTWCRRHD